MRFVTISKDDMLKFPAVETSDPTKLVADPTVSVLLLAYKHEKYIAQAIESIVAQVCSFPIEILIGEDFSDDRTYEICLEYQRRYPRVIRLISAGVNVGGCKNYLRLFSRARGAYVAICDGDDYWCSQTKLERQVELFRRDTNLVMTFSRSRILKNEKVCIDVIGPSSLKTRFQLSDMVRGNFVPSSTVCYKSNTVLSLPEWYLESPFGDWAMHLFHMEKGDAAMLPDITAIYRVHNGGAYSALSAKERWSRGVIVYKTINNYFLGKFEYQLAKASAKGYINIIRSTLPDKKIDAAVALWKHIRLCPINPIYVSGTIADILLTVMMPTLYLRIKTFLKTL